MHSAIRLRDRRGVWPLAAISYELISKRSDRRSDDHHTCLEMLNRRVSYEHLR